MLRKWESLPDFMKCGELKPYYAVLSHKRIQLAIKRLFDIVASVLMLLLLSPVFLILAIAIKIDSRGPVFFRQVRVTSYGREFRIFKFRTMVVNAEKIGSQVTVDNDDRITRVGGVIRNCRLDEIPQLLNILIGDMSFVGTRPEVPRYVNAYTPEMNATLLLPAGVTSIASIKYKDEAELLSGADNPEKIYIEKVLPAKMKYNLEAIMHFSLWRELKTMLMTVGTVFGK